MTRDELISSLQAMENVDVCIDVDDGVRGSYKDIKQVMPVVSGMGDKFIALTAEHREINRGEKRE